MWGAGEKVFPGLAAAICSINTHLFGGLPELGHTSTLIHLKKGGRQRIKKLKENLMRWGEWRGGSEGGGPHSASN